MSLRIAALFAAIFPLLVACASSHRNPPVTPESFVLDYNTPTDRRLQARIEAIDARLRAKYGISTEQTAVGVLDLNRPRLAMIHPDRIEYAASVAKVGILLAYFQLYPDAATQMDAEAQHELGLMIKASSNEMAAKYSRAMGLREIQQVLNAQGFYDAAHGGGIWVANITGRTASASAIRLPTTPMRQRCASSSVSTGCCRAISSSRLPRRRRCGRFFSRLISRTMSTSS